jgi:uncharacterized Fe-S radical SAM superfamily protein PflX
MAWVAKNIPGTYFNLMFQYRPEYRSSHFPEIDRRPYAAEKKEAVELAGRYDIELF